MGNSDCGHPWTSKYGSSGGLTREGGKLILANAGLEGRPWAGVEPDVSGVEIPERVVEGQGEQRLKNLW